MFLVLLVPNMYLNAFISDPKPAFLVLLRNTEMSEARSKKKAYTEFLVICYMMW